MAAIKVKAHEFRYNVPDVGQDVYVSRNYPSKTLTVKDMFERDLVLENEAPATYQAVLVAQVEALMDARIEFNESAATVPFTDIDNMITALVALRNAKATAQGVASVGTYSVA